MRLAALIVGLVGGLAGCAGSIFMLIFSVFAWSVSYFETAEAYEITILGPVALAAAALGLTEKISIALSGVALLISLLGLAGAASSISKPRLAALLMLISALVGLIAIFVGYIVAAILLGIAALLAFLGREPHRAVPQPSHSQV
jgi:hypothetical protein